MIREVIEQVDNLISDEEEALIVLANERYDLALKAAVKEFRAMEELDPDEKIGGAAAQKIISKALDAFNLEFDRLTEPIQKATLKCYDLGLKETGQIIEEANKE